MNCNIGPTLALQGMVGNRRQVPFEKGISGEAYCRQNKTCRELNGGLFRKQHLFDYTF